MPALQNSCLFWFLATWFLVPFSHAAVNASQTLVLQSGGTERARLTATTLAAANVSSTEISTTLIKLQQVTSQPTCNAAAKGQMLYTTSSTAPLQFCDGTKWRRITIQ